MMKEAITPSNVRRVNQWAILQTLLHRRSATRADLAKMVGMSQVTAGKIVEDLLKRGILEEVGEAENDILLLKRYKKSGRLGRPGQYVQLNAQEPRFLAVAMGVEQTSLAVLPLGISEKDQWNVYFPTPRSEEEWLRQLKKAATKLPITEFWAILVSVPGFVVEETGKVLFSPNMHWIEQADLPKLLHEVFKGPVRLMQEIRALALGQLATDPTNRDFLLVDFGYGVGGAAMVGGKLYTGPLPLISELGHTPVAGNKRCCGCGAEGCIETLVARRGLVESFAAEHPEKKKDWATLVEHVNEKGLEPWLKKTLDQVAIVLAGAINVLGMQRIIITGDLKDFPKTVTNYVCEAVAKGALWGRFGQVTCQTAPQHRIRGMVSVGIDYLLPR